MIGGHYGGTAIIVRLDVPFFYLRLRTPLQVVTALIYLKQKYAICCLHIHTGAPVERVDLDSLVRVLPFPVSFTR